MNIHIVSIATMNTRDTTSPNNGVWVAYKELHEATTTHYNQYTSVLEDPAADTDDVSEAPYGVNVKSANDVRWVNNECNPASSADPDVSGHYTWFRGNQWDWLYFFWNLWTSTSASTRYEVDEIENIWDNVSTTTRLCCNGEDVCNTYSIKPSGGSCPLAFPYTHTVGKPWVNLRNEAASLYGGTKGDYFYNTGVAAGVSTN